MLFESFHRRIRRLSVKREAFMYHWVCWLFFNLLFFQTFSSKVSQCNRESWRTNCSSLTRKTEACLMSTSPLWGGMTLCQKTLICIHSWSRHNWSREVNDFFALEFMGGWMCVFIGRGKTIRNTSSLADQRHAVCVFGQDNVKQRKPLPVHEKKTHGLHSSVLILKSRCQNLLPQQLTNKNFISGYLQRWKLLTCPWEFNGGNG